MFMNRFGTPRTEMGRIYRMEPFPSPGDCLRYRGVLGGFPPLPRIPGKCLTHSCSLTKQPRNSSYIRVFSPRMRRLVLSLREKRLL